MGKQVGPVLEMHKIATLEEGSIPVAVVEIMEIILVTRKILIAQIVLDIKVIEVIEIILHIVIGMIFMQETEENTERVDTKVVIVIEKWKEMRTLNQSYQGILNQ